MGRSGPVSGKTFMADIDVQTLSAQVLWAVFFLAVAFGAVAQKTHFCTMGAVADLVTMGDGSRMRAWITAMAVAVLGFQGMVGLGWIDPSKTIYTAPRLTWLSHLVGGLLFGFGMVLASGCGGKTLVRIGGGSLKSLVVFIVLGLSAFATMRGLFGVWRVATVDQLAITLDTGQNLPSIVASWQGISVPAVAAWLGPLLAVLVLLWVLHREEGRSPSVWLTGCLIGALVAAMWWVTGVLGHVAEHPQTLEEVFLATNSQRMESFTFVAPMAYTLDWFLFYSDKSKVLSVGVVSCIGVILGSAAVALATRTFRWEGFASTEDTAWHLLGAVLMGVGGVTAMGCTIGQGLSGISTLSLGSFLTLAGVVMGARWALQMQLWRLERSL